MISTLSSSSLIYSSVSFNLLLIPSNAFSSQLLYSSSLFDFLLHFLTLLKTSNLSFCSYNPLLGSLNIFMITTLNFSSGRWPISTSLVSLGVSSCSFGTYSSVTSFYLICCVFFFSPVYSVYWLHFLTLENSPFIAAAQSLLVTRAVCFRGAPSVDCVGPSVEGSWVLWKLW